MPRAAVNGIELEYEVTGEGEPLVLIMGIGAQMVHWPPGFIEALVAAGYQVIRFDNRDVGLSSKIDGGPLPPVQKSIGRALFRLPIEAPYRLEDMADDTAALLDHLGLESAHVAGVSMGGMVAQTMAIRHPERMRSLSSIMSAPGNRRSGLGKPSAITALLGKAPRNRAEAVDRMVRFNRVTGSTKFRRDEDALRERAGIAYDRCFHPRGFAQQMLAILSSGSRVGALPSVRVPTLVIHGTVDPLIRPYGGKLTARLIPEARLRLIDGMGHDLPRGAWPMIVDAIDARARSSVNER